MASKLLRYQQHVSKNMAMSTFRSLNRSSWMQASSSRHCQQVYLVLRFSTSGRNEEKKSAGRVHPTEKNADRVESLKSGDENICNSSTWSRLVDQAKSPPNMITLTRLASIPFLSYFIVSNQYHAAAAGCCIAAFSDWLDGHLAKRYNMKTVLGTYLDPLADKFFINSVAISCWYVGSIPTPLAALWCLRDTVLMSLTYWHVARHTDPGKTVTDPLTVPLQVTPTTISKVNTALQFITLFVTVVHPEVITIPNPEILPVLWWVNGGTTVLSTLSYMNFSAFSVTENVKGPGQFEKKR